jgi:hypothetical protein
MCTAISQIFKTFFVVVPAMSDLNYVWPLTNLTYSYEMKGLRVGNYYQCGFHFGGNHPSFAGAPLQLDGDKYPYIDIFIGDWLLFESFSFAMFVNSLGSTGCIFHFKSLRTVNAITEVSVCINDTWLTMISRTPSRNSQFRTYFESWYRGDWIMVQAGRSVDDETMTIRLKNDLVNMAFVDFDQLGSKSLGLPGTLRIGAKHDSISPLSLTITCITLYDSIPEAGSVLTEIECECKSSPSTSGENFFQWVLK